MLYHYVVKCHCSTILAVMQASHVRTLADAIETARDKERRKRKPGPAYVPGFVIPLKALQPVLPILLQGVLQVRTAALVKEWFGVPD